MHDPYLKRSPTRPYNFVLSASSLPLMVGLRIRRCCTVGIKLEPSPLRLPTLHSGSSPALPFAYQKFEHVRKFEMYVYLRISSYPFVQFKLNATMYREAGARRCAHFNPECPYSVLSVESSYSTEVRFKALI